MGTSPGENSDDTLAVFGHLVKRLRLASALTQEELAERAGVSARLISDLERGSRHQPRRDTARLLADGLHLTGPSRNSFLALARGRPVPASDLPAAGGPPVTSRLPVPPAPIVGRLKETAAATALLLRPEVRLLTLTGPGGVGKTRLALEVASRAEIAFADGAVFVDLAPVQDPTFLRQAVAQAVGRHLGQDPSPSAGLEFLLHGRTMLLVLDNVEHLIAGAFDLAKLLASCPGLTMLATSRELLRIRAERQYDLAPLALPDLERVPPVDELARVPAVDLFVARAAAANRSFALTPENAVPVAEIVARLDGLPLAIELAAARVRVFSPAALLTRLQQRLPLLTGGAADLPARQRTMRAAISWSYDLLGADERRLFRRLAVFESSFPLEGVAVVALDREPEHAVDSLNLLAALVDKSLIRALPALSHEQRFSMLDIIREFALECLVAAGEEAELRSRHAALCVELVAAGGPEPIGPNQERWFARLERDYPNLRGALGWAVSHRDAETALRLAGALYRFWASNGRLAEGSQWLQQALAIEGAIHFAPRANALLGAGVMAFLRGEYERASERWAAARQLYLSLGDVKGVAYALGNLGLIASQVQGDVVRARTHFEDALALYRELGDQSSVGYMLRNLGIIGCSSGDYAAAEALFAEALAVATELGDEHSIAMSLGDLGLAHFLQGNNQRAAELHTESLTLGRTLHNTPWIVRSLEHFALIAVATGNPERAARLFGAAGALRRATGLARVPSEDALLHPYIAGLRDQLGDEPFAAAWRSGECLSLEDATDYALGNTNTWSPLGA